MIGIIIISFWFATRKGADISRRQARVLLWASMFPIFSNLAYLFQPVEYRALDWTSVTFSVSSSMFVWALYGMRLMDLVPIARDKVIDGLSDGMIVLDIQNRIIDINQVAADILRSSLDKLSGKDILESMPYARFLKEPAGDKEIRTELEFGQMDKRYFDVLTSPLFEDQTRVVGRLIIFRDITERNQARLEMEERLLEIQELHRDLQESQAQLVEQQRNLAMLEERQRLARELHDSVNQTINGMVLFTETLAATLEKNNVERARQIMERLQESAKQSLKETRLMLYGLQDSGPKRNVDLIRNLEERLATVEGRVGVRTQLIQDGAMEYCPSEWQEDLFWIAVEALNNSLKHAQARSVQIAIHCSRERVELEVTDDGVGFDTGRVKVGGLGLKNMQERAVIIGGNLHIESRPSIGTTVRFEAEIKAK
jgi:PAS domain S-box-containing protein